MPVVMSPLVAVIIPHFNDVDRLARCLSALAPQVSDDVEVIVVDNASTQSLDGIKADFPWAKFLVQREKGAGPARNMGVLGTDANTLMFVDSDCLPAPDWVKSGRSAVRPGAVVGGPVPVFHETAQPRSGAQVFEELFAFKMKAYLERDGFLGAGNLVTTREVFEQTGDFRTGVSEDKEWSQRAAQRGFDLLFSEDMVASHPSRQNWSELKRKWERLTSEMFLLDAADARGKLRWTLKALAMPLSAFAHTPRILMSSDLTLAEKARGVVTLYRLRFARLVWMLKHLVSGPA